MFLIKIHVIQISVAKTCSISRCGIKVFDNGLNENFMKLMNLKEAEFHLNETQVEIVKAWQEVP